MRSWTASAAAVLGCLTAAAQARRIPDHAAAFPLQT